MNSGNSNLPSRDFRYIHAFALNKTLNCVPLDKQKATDIIKYINWLNIHHRFDAEWFEIMEAFIREYKLAIVYFFRRGLERLTLSKNVNVVSRFEKQIGRIIALVKDILKQINPQCTMRSFRLKFLEQISLAIDRPSIFAQQKRAIKLTKQEIILYNLVQEFKICTWKCKRRIKETFLEQDSFDSGTQNQQIQFQKIDSTYRLVYQKFRKYYNLFQLKCLEDEHQSYEQAKQKYLLFYNQIQYPKSEASLHLDRNTSRLVQCLKAGHNQQKETAQQSSDESVQIVNQNVFFAQSQNLTHDQASSKVQSSKLKQGGDERLCCREYFIGGQKVGPQTRDVEYKNYKFPWKQNLQMIIGKTTCGFLNSNGGNIYVGVQEDDKFQRKVAGQRYSQAQKQQLLRMVRQIAQTIKPDVIANQLYEVTFIPVRTSHRPRGQPSRTLTEHYVVKISVRQGLQSQLYTIRNQFSNSQEVYIRTQNEVLCYKNIHQILQVQRERLMKHISLQCLYPHQNPCSNMRFKQNVGKKKETQKKQLKTEIKLEDDGNRVKNTKTIPNVKKQKTDQETVQASNAKGLGVLYQSWRSRTNPFQSVASRKYLSQQQMLLTGDVFPLRKNHHEDQSFVFIREDGRQPTNSNLQFQCKSSAKMRFLSSRQLQNRPMATIKNPSWLKQKSHRIQNLL